MSAASFGRIPEAVRIAELALAGGGDRTALNAMLGTLHCRSGNVEAGIRHLRVAHADRPDDPVIAANLGSALAEASDYAAALEVVSEPMAASDPTMRLARLRAFAAQMQDDLQTAAAWYERIVLADPQDWESWNNLGNVRRSSENAQGALEALEKASKLCPDSPPVQLNHALALAATGQIDEAEGRLKRIAEDFPSDVKALSELHALYKEQAREGEALEAIRSASQREPENVDLLLALGSHLLAMLRTEEGEKAYRRAIEIEPGNGPANLGLALAFELTNRGPELTQLTKDAEARGVPPNALNFIQAFDHRRAKRFEEGLHALAQVPEELESARRWHLLGQLHEGVGNYDEAFAAYSQMNEKHIEDPSQPEVRASRYRDSVRAQKSSLSSEWLARWTDVKISDERPSPIFLVGFPRSGTTLLDTMLMGHPFAEVLEEEPTLVKATRFLPPFDDLAASTEEQVRAARDEYFRVAGKLVPLAPGKVLIDKNPLSMNGLPVIRRLFPDARVILALRHPCDVVLSCYVTNFKTNDGMSNFLHLDTAAELYDLSFSYFEQARELLDMAVHKVIYENVVADREKELRALLEFVGLDWDDQVMDHETTALQRGRIKTASYAQVAQPIYERSAGRWRNFSEHLEPVLPVLQPWIAKFGYTL